MSRIKFKNQEIIVIVKEFLKDVGRQCTVEEEFYLPKPIENKINMLSSEDRTEFLDICDKMSQGILELKSGELNEINMIHNEIIHLAKEKLTDYM